MYSKNRNLHKRIERVLDVLSKLEESDRYRACLIFGSIVRGEFVNGSDIDVKIVIGKGKHHPELNHLSIDGFKLDISFNSIESLRKDTEKELEKAKRAPIMAESLILFDKDGKLKKLVREARKRMSPQKYEKSQYDWIKFVILNEDLKVRRYLEKDPVAADYVMHTGLQDVIDMYYSIVGRWHVSNKKTLADLKKHDPKLKNILVKMMSSKNMQDKFFYWTKMMDYILNKIGGRTDIEKTGCHCGICHQDIDYLKNLAQGNSWASLAYGDTSSGVRSSAKSAK